MPPVVIAAGVSAAAGLAGAAINSSSAKKAAQAQQNSTAQQIAESRRNQEYITGLYQPTINRSNSAGDLAGNFLGLNGGTAAADALGTFRNSTGYNDLLQQGLGAVNANAYARGTGQSGATYKALQDRGTQIANGSAQQWLGNLYGQQQLGNQAIGNIAGVAQNTTNNINGATQAASDATGNAALLSGNAWSRGFQGLFNAGATAYGSSYQPAKTGYAPQAGSWNEIPYRPYASPWG